MKINEVENFPKALLKKKEIPLYKAFILRDPEEEMKINVNIDLLSLTMESAISRLINELPTDIIANEFFNPENLSNGITISFAIITLDKDDLLTKDLVDKGDVYFQNEAISITLKDKIYKVDVVDKILTNITIDIDDKTEERICSNIELMDA